MTSQESMQSDEANWLDVSNSPKYLNVRQPITDSSASALSTQFKLPSATSNKRWFDFNVNFGNSLIPGVSRSRSSLSSEVTRPCLESFRGLQPLCLKPRFGSETLLDNAKNQDHHLFLHSNSKFNTYCSPHNFNHSQRVSESSILTKYASQLNLKEANSYFSQPNTKKCQRNLADLTTLQTIIADKFTNNQFRENASNNDSRDLSNFSVLSPEVISPTIQKLTGHLKTLPADMTFLGNVCSPMNFNTGKVSRAEASDHFENQRLKSPRKSTSRDLLLSEQDQVKCSDSLNTSVENTETYEKEELIEISMQNIQVETKKSTVSMRNQPEQFTPKVGASAVISAQSHSKKVLTSTKNSACPDWVSEADDNLGQVTKDLMNIYDMCFEDSNVDNERHEIERAS